MSRGRGALVVLAIGLASTACSLLPPQIECNGIEPAVCQRLAAKAIADKRAEQPQRRVVRLVVRDERGSYEFTLDDGSGGAMIVD
jgi:hypothetical protein